MELLLALPALALADSLSYGTLTIPVWLLLEPGRVRGRRVFTYLLTIAAFYFAVGLGLLWSAGWLLPFAIDAAESPAGHVVLLVTGIALVIWSFALDSKGAKAKRANGGGLMAKLAKWRTSDKPVATVAVAAGLIELLTMLPYLVGIGLISSSDASPAAALGLLAGYCLVMVLPALALFGLRAALGSRVEGLLDRINAWMLKHGESALSWVVGILGVVLIVNNLNLVGN
ncbi:GAP family protein [Gulosibacter sediminis]|uniref:GAP family protein n=1 Tax=Gulosibacter sediminis TaxID=1729695 RepID=UPI0024AD3A91|nr:GAP family protein [Gulosibacter sediminis]